METIGMPGSVLDEHATRMLDAAEKVLDGAPGGLDADVAGLVHAVLYGIRHVSHSHGNLQIDDASLDALHLRADALMPRLERNDR